MKIFTIIKEVSQRVPDKNFIDLDGHPLWWHLLSELDGLDVTVNTDSKKFLGQLSSSKLKSVQVVERDQKHVNWENDDNIDTSPVEDMLFDFCKKLDRLEIVILTHITSPFLKKETLFDAVNMLQNNDEAKSIHSVLQIQDFVWIKKNTKASPINFKTDCVQRTQDLSPIMVSKGAFFIAQAGDIMDQKKRLPDPLIFYPLNHVESIEIDNYEDLKFARILRSGR